MNSVLMK